MIPRFPTGTVVFLPIVFMSFTFNLYLSRSLGSRRRAFDRTCTSLIHFFLFLAASRKSLPPSPVHLLRLSYQLVFDLSFPVFPVTVPCMKVFATPLPLIAVRQFCTGIFGTKSRDNDFLEVYHLPRVEAAHAKKGQAITSTHHG